MTEINECLSWRAVRCDIRNLLRALPEVHALRMVIERNDWHADDALRQSLRLCWWLETLPDALSETPGIPEKAIYDALAAVVDTKHSQYTLRELLVFVGLIHDVGKTETYQELSDGTTRCPGHEMVSARLAPEICKRFDFSLIEADWITTLVAAHGEPYARFKALIPTFPLSPVDQSRCFETEDVDHLLPLLLLAYGDLVTSHLPANRPEQYKTVLDFYRGWLQTIIRS